MNGRFRCLRLVTFGWGSRKARQKETEFFLRSMPFVPVRWGVSPFANCSDEVGARPQTSDFAVRRIFVAGGWTRLDRLGHA